MPALAQNAVTATSGATSTTDEVLHGVNLRGKRVLVTGVSAGLGVETARALVAHGADVVGAARDLAKAKRATAGVNTAGGNGGEFELVELDLASLDSVRGCADALRRRRQAVRPRHRQRRRHGDAVARPQTGSRPSSAPTISAISFWSIASLR